MTQVVTTLTNSFELHEVAGGIVLNNGKIVIVDQKPGGPFSFPKGHLNPGENHLVAAIREINEEAGISELELVRPLGNYTRKTTQAPNIIKKMTMFLFTTNQVELNPLNSEHHEAFWKTPEEMIELLYHNEDKEFLKRTMFEQFVKV